MPTQEEILLDELLDATKAGSIDQTIKVFPDASRLDPNKTSGRGLRVLFTATINRLKDWVKAELLGKANATHGHTISEVDNLQTILAAKADLVDGKIPASQLPEMGSAINSTDQLAEGTTNLYFTKSRVRETDLAGYAKAGTMASIATTDTIPSALGKLEKKVDDIVEIETSYAFLGGLEASDRYSFPVEFTSIDPGQRLTDVQISVEDAAYAPLVSGFLVAAGKRFKIKITYLTPTTEGVLITRVKKQ